jgi:hypothetical protein
VRRIVPLALYSFHADGDGAADDALDGQHLGRLQS